MTAPVGDEGAERFYEVLRTRRVCRSFRPEPPPDAWLRRITEAARWASSAGNRHIHKFLVVRSPERIQMIRAMAPGMLAAPPALIVVLTDRQAAERGGVRLDLDPANEGDVGTAAMNMLNMAHALGLGACPVTSFSRTGVAVVLDLPEWLQPEWLVMLGFPAPAARVLAAGAPKPLTARDLTWWDEVGRHDP
jgi:nitroreductase